jgi:hypothetical protein
MKNSTNDITYEQLTSQETELQDENKEEEGEEEEGEEGEEEEGEEEEEESSDFFDPTQIRITTKQITMDLLIKRIEYEEINLNPDFQRNANIWTDKAKSRLIESLLIRIPLPAFYMDATEEEKWLIIDGLQRLSTFKSFILDEKLVLKDLEFLKDLEKKKYSDLSRNYKRRIDEAEFIVYLIEPGTPPKVKYNIFRRINTGGLPLNLQEFRQAINPGQATKILKELANIPEFQKLTSFSQKRKDRMVDHEFILGFIAFTLISYNRYSSEEGRDDFLDRAMKKLNKINENRVQEIKNKFIFAMKAANNIFGKDAFRKITEDGKRKYPINKALFESWSVTLSDLNEQELETLIERKEKVKEVFIKKMQDDSNFLESVSQAATKVPYRFDTIKEIIKEVLSC